MINRSRLQSYIRPVYGDLTSTPGPDGNRALVPHLLVVILKPLTSGLSGSTRAGLTYLPIPMNSVATRIHKSVLPHQATHRYACSFAINAQRMRAFLLASATAVRLTPRRFFNCISQWLRFSFFVLQRKTIERAP